MSIIWHSRRAVFEKRCLYTKVKTFYQWLVDLSEKSRRTALGPYPLQYGAGNFPPEDNMTKGAGALFSMKKIHRWDDKKKTYLGFHPEKQD